MNFCGQTALLILFLPSFAFGRNPFGDNLDSELTPLFTSPNFAKAVWSCCISDINSGQRFYEFNSNTPLIPASNQKLLVIAASLLKAGPDYKSRTDFIADGPIENGTLKGNLIVSGHGAIHFSTRCRVDSSALDKSARLQRMLDQFAQRVRKVGINTIGGDVITDCSEWTDMPKNTHYPSAGPLSFHENTLDLDAENGVVHHCPQTLFGFKVQYKNWRGKQKKVRVNGNKTDLILVNLTRNSSDYWRLDTYSPSTYYRDHIKHALSQRGITIKGHPFEPVGNINNRYTLFYLESLPLHELITGTGRYSDNFRAETLFLNLGYLVYGKANYRNAQRALLKILSESGLAFNNMSSFDGSGLSRKNRISSADMTGLLNFMLETQHKRSFIRCLPVSGESGTLKNKLLKDILKGRVVAKTGTLRGVTALSGYILKKSEPIVSFSFICNKSPSTQQCWRAMEAALSSLVKRVDRT